MPSPAKQAKLSQICGQPHGREIRYLANDVTAVLPKFGQIDERMFQERRSAVLTSPNS